MKPERQQPIRKSRVVYRSALHEYIGSVLVVFATISLASCSSRPTPITSSGPSGRGSTPATAIAPATPGIQRQTTVSPEPSTTSPALAFDGDSAYKHALAQCAIGPRSAGSEGDRRTADYIAAQLKEYGWKVDTQDFEFRGVPIRNVIGSRGSGPLVILGAHFDSRKYADRDPKNPTAPVPAGNDGASGVAVLLELARIWSQTEHNRTVWLAFFDAEDNGEIDGWPWSVGATHMADTLPEKPEYVIVVDMIGDTDQQIYLERNSDPELQQALWKIAASLGYEQQFIPHYKWAMTDDHTPFLQRGVRAVDLIDFDYPYWHTTQDTCDKVSPDSLERVGAVLDHFVRGDQP